MKYHHAIFHRRNLLPIGGGCEQCDHIRWRMVFTAIDSGVYGWETVHQVIRIQDTESYGK